MSWCGLRAAGWSLGAAAFAGALALGVPFFFEAATFALQDPYAGGAVSRLVYAAIALVLLGAPAGTYRCASRSGDEPWCALLQASLALATVSLFLVPLLVPPI